MKLALFDLDGTLTDSGEGIFKSIIYCLEKTGNPIPSQEILNLFIGPPIVDSLQAHCDMTKEEAYHAYAVFGERYQTIGKYENTVYPHIREMLQKLKDCGFTLAVATAKPEFLARDIFNHFDLTHYFDVIKGAHNDRQLIHKEDILLEALADCEAYARGEQAVDYTANDLVKSYAACNSYKAKYMVGDRMYDMEAAVALSCVPIGVTYGFGTEEELTKAGAKVLCEDALAVADYIIAQ